MKKVASFIVAVAVVFSMLLPASAATDVNENYRFYEEIQYLLDEGIITGYSDGTFRPNQTVTRAEAAIMIGRMNDWDGTQQNTVFKDVSKSMKASGYIASGAKAGVITGYPDGTFKPYEPVTRGDMAIFLARALDLVFAVPVEFTDVSDNMRSFESISLILQAHITTGYPDNTYRPNQPITRGEFSAFLARGLEPAFKNDTHMEGSFLKDKTKTYTFSSAGETFTESFEDVPDIDGLRHGFMWVTRANGEEGYYIEVENRSGYLVGYPYSEGQWVLQYPIEVGKQFNVGYGEDYFMTYTGVNETVETAYGTFTNAVEVTDDQNGGKLYYVPGYALVKMIDAEGNTLSELISVE